MSLKRLYRTKKLFVSFLATIVLILVSPWFIIPQEVRDVKIEIRGVDVNNVENYDDILEVVKGNMILNKGEGCAIPKLDPFDKETMKLEMTLPTGACTGNDWVECILDECFVTKRIQDEMKVMFCVYRDINLKSPFSPSTKLSADQRYKLTKSDFIDVSCFGTRSLSPATPLYWSGQRAGLRYVPHKPSRRARLSVMLLSIDSPSKNSFIRRMPKSYAELQKMGAIILNGYNVGGEGPSGALLPILSGTSITDLMEAKLKLYDRSFMFSRLSELGYRTALFEDQPFLDNLQKLFKLFEQQPTDHYLLPFIQETFGDHYGRNRSFCMEGTPLHALLLNLTYQFSQLNGSSFSFTFITDNGRDDLTMAPALDEDLAFFLHRMQQNGKLEDMALFVMGNHAPSILPIRGTLQGRLEERLPLMAMVLPGRLQQLRPGALEGIRANIEVVTTPFDIHATLIDILGIRDTRNHHKVPGADTERGLTLLEPIPATRSCGEAGLLPHWCACADWHPISPQEPMYNTTGVVIVDYINSLIANWRKICRTRKVVRIEYVLSHLSKNKLSEYKKKMWFTGMSYSNYYQAKVISSPGWAVYEGTVRHDLKSDSYILLETEISRLDRYMDAEESACIRTSHPFLNKYCYCVSNTENFLK